MDFNELIKQINAFKTVVKNVPLENDSSVQEMVGKFYKKVKEIENDINNVNKMIQSINSKKSDLDNKISTHTNDINRMISDITSMLK